MTNKQALSQKLKKGLSYIFYPYYKFFRSSEVFEFQGKRYHYFCHPYNTTWRNERAVEIPIIMDFIRDYCGKNILEMGNVLQHYFPFKHDIIDKYEKSEVLINQDIVDFKPKKKYDLIISISTIEHAGWDEDIRDDTKIEKAIEVLKSCLDPNGKIVITFPQGYNSILDQLDRDEKLQFNEKYCLMRVSKNNIWREIHWSRDCNKKFGKPYNNANAITIGIINAQKNNIQ